MKPKKTKANGKDTSEPPKREVKCEEFLKVSFTKEDLEKKGQDLARENGLVAEIELQKKSVLSQFKDRRAACDQKIAALSREISNGYEMRTVECVARYHTPKSNHKSIIRLDTNEVVRVDVMTASERQELLPFKGETKADTAAATTAKTKTTAKTEPTAENKPPETKPEQATEAPF